jgi:hypothetical protein
LFFPKLLGGSDDTLTPLQIKTEDEMKAFVAGLYLICLTAETDALCLYGPVAILAYLLATWRDYGERYPFSLIYFFRDDCNGHASQKQLIRRLPDIYQVDNIEILFEYFDSYFPLGAFDSIEEYIYDPDFLDEYIEDNGRLLDAPTLIMNIFEKARLKSKEAKRRVTQK